MAGFFDTLFGSPDEDEKALRALQEAQGAYDGIAPLDLGPLSYEEAQYLGDYTPQAFAEAHGVSAPQMFDTERGMAATVGGSAFDDMSSDPRLRAAQLGALTQLQEIADGGGLTAADRAQLSKVQTDVAAADRGRRDAILQNMEARGMGGSNAELLAQLQSAQAANDTQSQRSMDVSALAQQRALDAIASQGQMAGQIRGQDFGEGSTRAEAKDRINQFNSQLVSGMSQFNAGQGNDANNAQAGRQMQADIFTAGAKNDVSRQKADAINSAGMAGWQARNNMNMQNTAGRNETKRINAIDIPKAGYDSRMGLAQGRQQGQLAGMNYWNQKGNQKAQTKAALAQGAMQVGGAALMSDERKKTAQKSFGNPEISEFLDSFNPKTFRYKNPKAPGQLPGQRVGFIAQDVDDTKLGKSLVSESEDGLQYDPINLQGIELAALKDLHDRIKRLEGGRA